MQRDLLDEDPSDWWAARSSYEHLRLGHPPQLQLCVLEFDSRFTLWGWVGCIIKSKGGNQPLKMQRDLLDEDPSDWWSARSSYEHLRLGHRPQLQMCVLEFDSRFALWGG